MNNFNAITEKIYPVEKKWIIKNVVIWSIMTIPFLAFVCSNIKEGFNLMTFIIVFIIGIITIPPIFYFFLILERKNYHYRLGDKIITLKQGIISKSERIVLYGRIQNVLIHQGFIDRILGFATVSIETASDSGGAKFAMGNNQGKADIIIMGFSSNRTVIPGLLYKNALSFKDVLLELIKLNPINDAQSGI